MKLLVPLAFDLSHQAHGRNLRVANLLRSISTRCELCCLAADETIASAAAVQLPGAQIMPAEPGGTLGDALLASALSSSYALWRAVEFHGYHPNLVAAVHNCACDFDAVLGFDITSTPYLLAAAEARTAPRRPLLACDLIDDPMLTWKSWPASRRLSATGLKVAMAASILRRQMLPRFDVLTAVAPQDAASLGQAAGKYVRVVPNGVQAKPAQWCQQREPLVVFTGAMNFPPNDAAARFLVRRIWPRVLTRLAKTPGGCPGASLALVGADPLPRLRNICAAAGVTLTGRVPDLSEWLRRARVAVAPMTAGTGIKNKVLEACAAGCPVVATPLGAAGLPTGPASGILVARDADKFARELAALLLDPASARALGAAGQAMIRRQFAWSHAADALMNAIRIEPAASGDESARGEADAALAAGTNREELAYAAS